MGPEQAAPAVVAVVVACGHGTWLDEALCSLATQDYPNLSVLVMEVGADEKVADRVAVFVPNAHFARMPPGTTFAQAANKALEMVEGAAHVLVCHDDVALAPDAVRLLLEEAYRSNAGLTCPKFVSWDHPDRLLSVGMGADHLGVVHPLVEPGELDQGQHDAAHEVFVAPSGAVLVRKDLWRALGGFSTAAGAPGEDLDLSWRAHLAGARVVVAPQARARHLEAGAKGLRRAGFAKAPRARSGPSKAGVSATAADGGSNKSNYGSGAASSAGPSIGPGPGPDQANGGPNVGMNGVDADPSAATKGDSGPTATTNGTHGPSPAMGQQPETVTAPAGPKSKPTTDEQRLRVLWTCYGPAGLVLVTPVAVLFAFAESLWALLHPRAGRGFLSPLLSLARSFSHPQALWAARRRAQKSRRVSDLAIWKAQSHGSARLRALVRPRLERGHELAWAATRAGGAHEGVKGPEAADGEGSLPAVAALGIDATSHAACSGARSPRVTSPRVRSPRRRSPRLRSPRLRSPRARRGYQVPGQRELGPGRPRQRERPRGRPGAGQRKGQLEGWRAHRRRRSGAVAHRVSQHTERLNTVGRPASSVQRRSGVLVARVVVGSGAGSFGQFVLRSAGPIFHGPCRCGFVRLGERGRSFARRRTAGARAVRRLQGHSPIRLAERASSRHRALCRLADPLQRLFSGPLVGPRRVRRRSLGAFLPEPAGRTAAVPGVSLA